MMKWITKIYWMGLGAVLAVPAHAAGLSKAKGILDQFLDQMLTIIPVVATITLICFGIAYAAKFLEKDTFVRWAIGIIIAGSASELTAWFFS